MWSSFAAEVESSKDQRRWSSEACFIKPLDQLSRDTINRVIDQLPERFAMVISDGHTDFHLKWKMFKYRKYMSSLKLCCFGGVCIVSIKLHKESLNITNWKHQSFSRLWAEQFGIQIVVYIIIYRFTNYRNWSSFLAHFVLQSKTFFLEIGAFCS